jgi:tripartite-type tricarboxylate transporter receptor subunit TctC
MPEVPTFAELGHAGLADTGWFAVFVPVRAPDDAKARLSEALAAVTAEPEVRQRLVEGGLEPAPSGEDPRSLWQRSLESARAVVARVKFDPN